MLLQKFTRLGAARGALIQSIFSKKEEKLSEVSSEYYPRIWHLARAPWKPVGSRPNKFMMKRNEGLGKGCRRIGNPEKSGF